MTAPEPWQTAQPASDGVNQVNAGAQALDSGASAPSDSTTTLVGGAQNLGLVLSAADGSSAQGTACKPLRQAGDN